MAQVTSGTVNTSKYDGRYYQLSWTAKQDVNTNKSTISWTLKAVGGNSSWYAERTLKLVIAGSTVYSKTSRVERYAGTIKTGTVTISHNTTGNASFSVSLQVAVYTSSVNCTGSGTFQLKTIPRASSISFGSSNVKPNASQTVNISRASSSFTHTLTYSCNGVTGTIATKTTSTSVSFTVPASLIAKSPNANQTMTVTCTTYSGNTAIGSKSATFTIGYYSPSTVSASSGRTLGSSMSVTISRNSSLFTHSMWYSFGSKTWQWIGGSLSTSASFTPPLSLCSEFPNATSGSIAIILRTYYGSTQIGSDKYYYYDMSVPSSVVPSVSSISLSEATSGLASAFGVYVKDKSTLNVKVNASGSYGSTIKTYRTSLDGITYTTQSFVSDSFNESGTLTITSTVTDSRGRTATKTTTINVVDYFRPEINKFFVHRCLENGTLDDNGTFVKVTYAYKIAPINNKNTKKASIQYLDKSSGDWISIAEFTDVYSKDSEYISTQEFSLDSAYQFRLLVEDYFYQDENGAKYRQNITSGYTLMNYHSSGKAIGFRKVADREEGFQFGDFIYDQWDTVITNGLAVYGGDPNTTLESLIMTSTNSPSGQAMYFFTFFSSNKSETQNCGQIAVPYYYNGTQSMYWRYRFGGEWSDWFKIANTSDLKWGNITGKPSTFPPSSHTHSYLSLNGGTLTGLLKANSGIVIPNEGSTAEPNNRIMGITTSGAYHHLLSISSNNNCCLNYGGYKDGIGNLNLYTSDGVNIYTKNNSSSYITGTSLSFYGAYSTGFFIACRWADNAVHDIVSRSSDGLASYIGPGSLDSSYKTTTNVRGYYVRLYAHSGGAVYLGSSGSTAVTSDRNLKKDIYDLNDKYVTFFNNLRPITYKYSESGHRDHIGFIAQEVEEALEKAELTSEEFAGLVIDENITLNPNHDSSLSDEENKANEIHYDKLYSLRYEEFIALNTYMIQKQQKEIDDLKKQIEELKTLVKGAQ